MATVTVLPTLHKPEDLSSMDLYGDPIAVQELHRQAEYMQSPPWNTPPKKLADALVAVERGRVTPPTEETGAYRVQGSRGTTYLVDQIGCSCPQGEHSQKTKYGCYHAVAVHLYQEWQRALQPLAAQITLLAPEKTVDERLATPFQTPPETPQNHAGDPIMAEDESVDTLTTMEALLDAPEAPASPLALLPPHLPLRSITAIVQDLSRPLPGECVAVKTVKGTAISYLHWQTVARVLDTYAPGWYGEITRLEQHGATLRETYRLHIPCAEGTVWREATGEDDEWTAEEDTRYGNPSANAQANAFKRAAALFGVGQWLYDKQGDPTAKALADHFRKEKQEAIGELGKALTAKGMSRQEVLTWLKTYAGVTALDQIPLTTIRCLLAYVAQRDDAVAEEVA